MPIRRVNPRARALRLGMTDVERRLWSVLRGRKLHGCKFRRQHALGPYIVDFACIEHRLVIEADGGQHLESENDQRRTAWLKARGWRVLRFWNNDVLANAEGVWDTILRETDTLRDPHPPIAARRAPPSPAPRARGVTQP